MYLEIKKRDDRRSERRKCVRNKSPDDKTVYK